MQIATLKDGLVCTQNAILEENRNSTSLENLNILNGLPGSDSNAHVSRHTALNREIAIFHSVSLCVRMRHNPL